MLPCPQQHLSCMPGAGPGWPACHSLPATGGGLALSLVAHTWCSQLLGSILERKGAYSSPLCSFLLAENSVCSPDPEWSAGSHQAGKQGGWAGSLTLRAPAWAPWTRVREQAPLIKALVILGFLPPRPNADQVILTMSSSGWILEILILRSSPDVLKINQRLRIGTADCPASACWPVPPPEEAWERWAAVALPCSPEGLVPPTFPTQVGVGFSGWDQDLQTRMRPLRNYLRLIELYMLIIKHEEQNEKEHKRPKDKSDPNHLEKPDSITAPTAPEREWEAVREEARELNGLEEKGLRGKPGLGSTAKEQRRAWAEARSCSLAGPSPRPPSIAVQARRTPVLILGVAPASTRLPVRCSAPPPALSSLSLEGSTQNFQTDFPPIRKRISRIRPGTVL